MADGSEINLHTIGPMDTATSRPVIKTTAALPIDSVLNQGLPPQEIEKDLFAYLSPENQARAAKMLTDNVDERNKVFGDMFSKTSILESHPEIPGNVPGRINALPTAMTELAINQGLEEATGLRVPPVNLNIGNSSKVETKVREAQSSGFDNFA